MKLPEPFRFSLNSAVDIARLSETLPTGFQLQHSIGEMGEARVLDTFDHTLRLSDRLLLQCQDKLLLFTLNKPSIGVQPCPANWRFMSDLADGAVKDELTDVSPLRAFLTICSFNLQTGRLVLLDDEEKTHARAYFYTFDQDDQTKTFGQTQPLQGYAKGHRILVDAFMEQGAQAQNKISDLYLFLGADKRIYCSKPGVALNPEAPACETTRNIIKTYIQVARENEPGIKADYDTEFLHDYRVSLRKVRSVLSLFKGVFRDDDTARLRQAFADIMKQTNRLRDLDVYLLEKSLYFSMIPKSLHEGLSVMFEVFATERQQQLKHVVDMLNSESYTRTITDLAEQFTSTNILKPGPKGDGPTLPFACRLIWKRYNKVCKVARRINSDTPSKEFHVLRIQCKKLRYLMEFFTPLFPQKTIKQLIKALKRLQDNLGRFNDFSVQQRSLQAFLQDYSDHHNNSITLAESIGALITVLHQRQQEERRHILENFARFDNTKTRTAFYTLFTQENKG
jgi:CHAD domain-containing protein